MIDVNRIWYVNIVIIAFLKTSFFLEQQKSYVIFFENFSMHPMTLLVTWRISIYAYVSVDVHSEIYFFQKNWFFFCRCIYGSEKTIVIGGKIQ